ncbi:NupC/NupG family nucleoside CNT transporter [Stella sp.]|uniref:NupC/NupG family nucleoside CNT transporter n=1 Tax=Stella sp. TaxID=2912054 RepID=UPI0035B429F5
MTPWAQSLLGVFLLAGLAWALGENRRHARIRPALAGIALQFALAVPLLWAPGARAAFAAIADGVLAIQAATRAGTTLVFGFLGGGPLPYQETAPGATFTLAFQALPIVLVFSALSALLFHWGIVPWVVRTLSRGLGRALGIGGAVSVSTAANVFVGMVEAPLLVRPYLARMRRSELFMVMVGGMASIAGTVFGLYGAILAPVLPEAFGHLLVASVVSAPAAITVARLMVPDDGPPTPGDLDGVERASGGFEALVRGTADGVGLLLQIVALLIVMVALVALANQAAGLLPALDGRPLTLERAAGWVFAPVAWLMGIPWAEALVAGELLGIKTVLNEFLAYLRLAAIPAEDLSERSRLILLYALCGFANFASLGIMVAGLAAMAPGRRADIVGLGPRSIVAGTLATCMTGAVVGTLI